MIELFFTNASWLAKVMSVVMLISPVVECDVVTSNKEIGRASGRERV